MIRRILCFLVAGFSLTFSAGCGANLGASFSLSGPHVVAKEGKPFMVLTTVENAGGNREFAYFIVIKPPELPGGGRQQSSTGEANAAGRKGFAKLKAKFNGRDLIVEYTRTARADGALESESLKLDGTNPSLDKGRVFLVDLSSEPIGVAQHDLKLPTTIPEIVNPQVAEKLAESTLSELEKDSAIAEFTRRLR